MMQQLTVRGFDDRLEAAIRDLARREGISLNQAVLRLLRRGAGVSEAGQRDNTIGDGLDDLAGTWSAEEARLFSEAVQPFDEVDEELWR